MQPLNQAYRSSYFCLGMTQDCLVFSVPGQNGTILKVLLISGLFSDPFWTVYAVTYIVQSQFIQFRIEPTRIPMSRTHEERKAIHEILFTSI
jgi:hypothetical protein